VPVHVAVMNLFRAIDLQIKRSWTNLPSWDQNAPKTAQVIVLVMNGALAKVIVQATVLTALVSTKVPI
jgi:hypothetical protein